MDRYYRYHWWIFSNGINLWNLSKTGLNSLESPQNHYGTFCTQFLTNITYRNQEPTKIDPEIPYEIIKSTTGISIPYIYTSSDSILCGTIPINFDDVSSIALNVRFEGDNSASPIINLAITDMALVTQTEVISNSIWEKTINHWTTGNIIIEEIDVRHISGYKYVSFSFRPGYSYSQDFYVYSVLLK